MNRKAKEPLLAVLFSLLCVGWGQIYAGRARRGLALLSTLFGGYLLSMPVFLHALEPQTRVTYFHGGFIALLILLSVGFSLWVAVDAYRCARDFNVDHGLERKKSFVRGAFLVPGVVIAFLLPSCEAFTVAYVKANFVEPNQIRGGAMRPTLTEGDRVFVDRRRYETADPERGDIVIYTLPDDPSRHWLSRILGLGGETIEIREGAVYVDGERISDPRLNDIVYQNLGLYGQVNDPVQIPEGQYYLLGDHSTTSNDSRFRGLILREDIVGKIYKIYWPPARSGPIP